MKREVPYNHLREELLELDAKLKSMTSMKDPEEEACFGVHKASMLPTLEVVPINLYYHLARNDLKYYTGTDGFPPLQQGNAVPKQSIV